MWSTIGSRRKWIGCNIIISQVFPHAQPGHSWMNGWWIGQPWLTAVSAMNGVQKDDEIIPSTHMFFVYFFIKKTRNHMFCFLSKAISQLLSLQLRIWCTMMRGEIPLDASVTGGDWRWADRQIYHLPKARRQSFSLCLGMLLGLLGIVNCQNCGQLMSIGDCNFLLYGW
jgi:hypothetical protein